MATTFSNAKSGLDDIAREIQARRSQLSQIQSLAASASGELAAMATRYSQLVADIDAAQSANPTNAAFSTMKAEKDLLVAEFNSLKAKADQFQTAVSGITF